MPERRVSSIDLPCRAAGRAGVAWGRVGRSGNSLAPPTGRHGTRVADRVQRADAAGARNRPRRRPAPGGVARFPTRPVRPDREMDVRRRGGTLWHLGRGRLTYRMSCRSGRLAAGCATGVHRDYSRIGVTPSPKRAVADLGKPTQRLAGHLPLMRVPAPRPVQSIPMRDQILCRSCTTVATLQGCIRTGQ